VPNLSGGGGEATVCLRRARAAQSCLTNGWAQAIAVTTAGAAMKIVGLVLLGLVFGMIAGAAIGVGLGLVWTTLFQTSCFEGYCGLLVFLTFMPIGSILGGLTGAVWLGTLAARVGQSRENL
jgi:hypothetical protein